MTIPPRRSFLATAAAMLGGAALMPRGAAALESGRVTPGDDIDPWIANLRGKHRQIHHQHEQWRNGLSYAVGFIELYKSEYGVPASDVNSIVAAHGKTGGIAFNDAAWDKYEFGRRFKQTDPKTKADARRNIFIESDDDTGVREALDKGVIILACNHAIHELSGWIASDKKYGMAADVEKDLISSVIPGIVVVPAMIIALGRAQENGCRYVFTG